MCHGTDSLGSELPHAPPIVRMDDWYLVQELRNFKEGARGTAAGDTWGITMRVNTLALFRAGDGGCRGLLAFGEA